MAKFLICFFFGFWGVHKFMEKKIGMGFLYLFTGGLFLIGWAVDCIRYLRSALDNPSKATSCANDSPTDTSAYQNDSAIVLPSTHLIKKNLLWIVVAFVGLLGLAFLCSGNFLAGLFAIAFVALLIPVDSWQTYVSKFIKGKLKVILSIVLVFAFLVTVPSTEAPSTETVPTVSTSTTSPAITSTTVSTTKTTIATTATTTTKVTTTTSTTVTTTTTTIATTTTTIHAHTFTDADCSSPQTCAVCGATEGSPLGHSWVDATCTSPKTCSVCDTTDGYATGHNYDNGECYSCGYEDPNYSSEALVWIPTKGGKKYHTHSGCSNMEDPEQVTESEAIELGFEPCKRCH